ncbi:S-adenosyl methyltransferase [Saccharopolyspora kobensis]|uniref:S-adenosyl methyltransferase n=1 Tax=Saccharopolyspora kobensis TaxID=146035 RepID=A0A1H5USJ3_9PSEU|nr:SAM-dependent methyltransferase [Saccharopolyspora kobensis]SEF78055.1 S-adenosyl methyltransferase [Saccharopolyspora kobensis]SFC69782.1 S-adenosyl methyltransferase [Saccharopolyspora kobensis]
MSEVSPEHGHIDLEKPNAARVYDYYLGGDHNFAVDRQMAEEAIAMWPDLPLVMQANRAFLRRAVQFCVEQGIDQFLDLGSGIPTVGNVHEVAQQAAPGARVVYVDTDPVAVAYSKKLLHDNPDAAIIDADMRDPGRVLGSPEVAELLDLSRPVAVMMVAVLHFVPDGDEPSKIIARYREVMAPGSFLVISHASNEGRPDVGPAHADLYRKRTTTPMTMRSQAEVTGFFDGFELVEPGVVFLPQWRPVAPDEVGEHPERLTGLAGVGRKP